MKEFRLERENSGSVWVLEIVRPPANTLTSSLIMHLLGVVTKFENDRKGAVLIITGGGTRFFIGGVDFSEIASIDSPICGYEKAKIGQDFCNMIAALRKPVIAAINGHCIGGGNEIAIACHIRVASEKATFQQPEMNLGIIPAFGGTQRLPRLIGEGRARKMILTCEKITAEEALELGLIDEVVDQGKVVKKSLEIAKVISAKSQVAVQLATRAIQKAMSINSNVGLEFELECFKKLCADENMKEALAAFHERRQAQFNNA